MRASLVSREVIADSIELAVRGAMCDGVVALSGCDKTIPGTMMALARLDVPGLMLYGGSIMPGNFRGKRSRSRTCSRRSAPARPAASPRASCARWRTSPARARAPAAASSPPTRCRWRARCWGSRRWGSNDVPAVDRAQGRGGDARRRDRHAPGRRGPAPQQDPDPRRVRQRHHRGRRDGGLDQRRAAPAGDRARGGVAADARRLRRDRRADADARRPQAGRPLLRRRSRARRRRSSGGRAAGWRRGCCRRA